MERTSMPDHGGGYVLLNVHGGFVLYEIVLNVHGGDIILWNV